MKIVTWNINSVRLRLENLKILSVKESPDIICLQETKVQDTEFPMEAINNIGYQHIYFTGEKSYNGVAILSKVKLSNIDKLQFLDKPECRHISALLPEGIELHNFYVPAGGDIADAEVNPKFASKLKFMDGIANWFDKKRKSSEKIILVGDINIAPLPNDVWSHKQLLEVVSHTPIEVEKMEYLYKTLEWRDAIRHFTPHEHKLYSWWSYRNRDWRKSNRGRRLDHIWITSPLISKLKSGYIIKDARDWKLPSDHVPVVTEFNI